MTETIIGLGKSEEWFWSSEPRIVINLIDEKNRIEKIKQKNLSAYISYCVWGKDPSELDVDVEKETKVAGRDYPISENLMRGLLL